MKAEEQQVVQAQLDSPVVAANATILEDRSFQKKKKRSASQSDTSPLQRQEHCGRKCLSGCRWCAEGGVWRSWRRRGECRAALFRAVLRCFVYCQTNNFEILWDVPD